MKEMGTLRQIVDVFMVKDWQLIVQMMAEQCMWRENKDINPRMNRNHAGIYDC